MSASYDNTASAHSHRIELGAGPYRERQRNHRASLRAEGIHAREVVEAGDGLCWVRLTRFGNEWLLIRSDTRDVSRAVRKLRQIPAGEQSDRFPEVGP